MRSTVLKNALPIVAAAYGRKFGVEVLVGGTQAMTNGRRIHLPALDERQADSKLLAYGYLTHEAGHLRHTDFGIPPLTSPLANFLEGVIEDVRIENAVLGDYPGSRITMDTVVSTLIDRGEWVPVTPTDQPVDILANGFLALARYRYRQQAELAIHAQMAERVMRQVFTPRFVNRLKGMMTGIAGVKSTAESSALALRIMALIAEESQPKVTPEVPQDSQEPQGAQGNQGTSQQEGGEQADAPDADTAQPSAGGEEGERNTRSNPEMGSSGEEGAPSRTGKEPNDGEHSSPAESAVASATKTATGADTAGQSGSADQEGEGDSVTGASDDTGRAQLRSTLGAGEGSLPEDLFAQVGKLLTNQASDDQTLLPTAKGYSGDRQRGEQMLQRVRQHSAHLTARLQGLVQAHSLTHHRTTRRGRTLDTRRLHRVAVADARIFHVKEHRHQPNTALHLVIDLSGSMARGRDVIALEAAMALALALEPIPGVSRAVTAFPGFYGLDDQVVRLLAHGQGVVSGVGAFSQRARGTTPMTGALWYAAADLMARQEDRKVMLVLTDGSPDHFYSAKAMVKQATQGGIEVLGVGIECEVGNLFPLAIRIDNIGDLKRELFRIAERLLLKE